MTLLELMMVSEQACHFPMSVCSLQDHMVSRFCTRAHALFQAHDPVTEYPVFFHNNVAWISLRPGALSFPDSVLPLCGTPGGQAGPGRRPRAIATAQVQRASWQMERPGHRAHMAVTGLLGALPVG